MADFYITMGLSPDVDTNEFQRQVNDVLSGLTTQPQKITITVESAKAGEQLRSLQAQIDKICAKKNTIELSDNFSRTLNNGISSINECVKRIDVLNQKLSGISGSAAFSNITDASAQAAQAIDGIRSEIASLTSAMSSFRGINLDLNLGGGNAIDRTRSYGQSARRTISELQQQAHQLESVLVEYYKIADGYDSAIKAVMRAVQGTDVMNGRDPISLLNRISDSSGSLQSQMDAWREYISVIQQAASIKGIDLSAATTSFSSSADQMISDTNKILSGEDQLQSGMEKLRTLFGTSIDSEQLNAQLSTINTSIENISTSLQSVNSSSLETFVTSINNVIAAIDRLIEATNGLSSMKVEPPDISSLGNTMTQISDMLKSITTSGLTINVPTASGDGAIRIFASMADSAREAEGAVRDLGAQTEQTDSAVRVSAESARDAANAASEDARANRDAADAANERANAESNAGQSTKDAVRSEKERLSVLRQYYGMLDQLNTALRNNTAAEHSRNESSRESYRLIKEEAEALAGYNANGSSTAEVRKRIAESANVLKEHLGIIRQNGDATKTFGERMGNLASKFGSWLTVSRVIMFAVRSMRQMITTSIELDEAMTQMQIVTRASESAMNDFADAASDAAKRVGSSITDFVSSATTFARLGYDMGESSQLAEYTAMLQNVGDIDVQDAQDAITSIVKAFNIDTDEIESVMDKLVITGNNFPISVSQIAEGMTNASSALAAAGNSFEQSVALLTAANTTIQDAAKASTGLRTITARFRNTKTELDELGETMTEATYNELIQALTDYNVALTDANGEYRSTYDIMSDIAKQWEHMTSMERSALATAASGNRQQAVFYSIIEQFREASGAMEAMSDSAGELSRAYGVYMDSVSAHIGQFKAAFQELSADVLQSDILNFFIDAGGAILNVVDNVFKLVNAVGGLRTALIPIVGIVAVLNAGTITSWIKGLATGIGNIIGAISKFAGAFSSFGTGIAMVGQNTTRLQAALNAAGITLTGFQMKVIAATLVITALVAIYSRWKQKHDEAIRSSIETGNAAAEEADKIVELYEAYQKALGAYRDHTGTKEALTSATNDLIDALGVESSRYEELVKKLGNVNDAMRELTVEKLRQDLEDLTTGYSGAADALLDVADSGWAILGNRFRDMEWREDLSQVQRVTDVLREAGINAVRNDSMTGMYIDLGNTSTIEGAVKAYNTLIEARSALIEAFGEKGASELGAMDVINEKLSQIQEQYKTYADFVDEIDQKNAQIDYYEYVKQNGVPETKEEFDAMTEAIEGSVAASNDFVRADGQLHDSVLAGLSGIGALTGFFGDYSSTLVDAEQKINVVMRAFAKGFDDASAYAERLHDELANWYFGLDDSDQQLVYEIALNTDTARWTLDQWVDALDEAQFHFEDLMAIEGEDGNKSFHETIDELIKETDELKEARNDLANGSLNEAELIGDFPELAGASKDIIDELPKNVRDAFHACEDEVNRFKELGFDPKQTLFGNIDTDNREIIEWNDEMLNTYRDELQSWYDEDTPWDVIHDELMGSYSTVMGTSEDFDGLEIAFSPMLQTDNGAVLLSSDTVYDYVWGLIDELNARGDSWTTEDLLALDVEGIEIDGRRIQGLIADVGETARATGEAMHYAGSTGSMADAYAELETAAKDASVSIDDLNGYLTGDKTRAQSMDDKILGAIEARANRISELVDQAASGKYGELSTDEDLQQLRAYGDAVLDYVNSFDSELFDKEALDSIGEDIDYLNEKLSDIWSGKELTDQEKFDLGEKYMFDPTTVTDWEAKLEELRAGLIGVSGDANNAGTAMGVFDAALKTAKDENSVKVIQSLCDMFIRLHTVTGEATVDMDALRSNLEEVDYVIDALAKSNSGDLGISDTMDIASTLAEKTGKEIDYYLEEVDGKVVLNKAHVAEYGNAVVEAFRKMGVSSQVLDEMRAAISNARIGALTDEAKEAKNAFDALAGAISNVQDAASLMSDIQLFNTTGSGDIVDILQRAASLSEEVGVASGDIINVENGKLQVNSELISQWSEKLVSDLANVIDLTDEERKKLEEYVTQHLEAERESERLTSAIKNVDDAVDLIARSRAGELGITEILQAASDLAEQSNQSINDFLTTANGKTVLKESAITAWINSVIDGLREIGVSESVLDELRSKINSVTTGSTEPISFADLINDDSTGNFSEKIDTFQESISKLAQARKDLLSGDFTDADYIDLVQQFPELAKDSDDLVKAIERQMKTLTGYGKVVDKNGNIVSDATGIMADFQDAFGRLDTVEDILALQALQDSVLSLVDTLSSGLDIDKEVEGMTAFWDAMKESVSGTGLTTESIESLVERYKDLEGYDFGKLFEKTANGVHLNMQSVRELESEYRNLKKTEIDEHLKDLTNTYNKLTEEINKTDDAAKLANLYAERDKVKDEIDDIAILAAQYEGLTSAYNQWQEAKGTPGENDMFLNISDSIEDMEELFNSGWHGSDDIRGFAQIFTDEDLSTAPIEKVEAAFKSAIETAKMFFNGSTDGLADFLKAGEKVSKEKGIDWITQNENGKWEIDLGVGNDAEFVEAFNEITGMQLSVESLQILLRALGDTGWTINLDSIYTDLDLAKTKAEEANEALGEMGITDYKFNLDTDDLDDLTENQIPKAEKLLADLSDGGVNIDAEGCDEVRQILLALIVQKQRLSEPEIMSIDTSQLTGADQKILEAITLLQEFTRLSNELETRTALGLDTKDTMTKLQNVTKEINSLPDEVKTKVGIDTSEDSDLSKALSSIENTDITLGASINQEDITTIQNSIDGIEAKNIDFTTNSNSIKAELDEINAYKIGNKRFTVSVSNKASTVLRSIKGLIDKLKDKTVTVTTVHRTVYESGSGTGKADGTAYANGTIGGKAYRSGDWGTKNSGVALGGELGRELVVRDGKYFTIGDNGAEFFRYRKGDIIFNAAQTEEIFEKGRAISNSGRGRMVYADGTAFSSGSGGLPSGGGSSGGGKKPGKTGGGGSSGGDDEDEPEKFDWIEVLIDRIERAIESLARVAESTFKTLRTRLVATSDEIKKVSEEIEYQKQGYSRYIQEAASIDLSEDIKKLVRDGAIDIREYDAATADLIKEYQEWYEKALDCADAVEELNEKLSELYESRFKMVEDEYENQLELLEHMTNTYTNGLDEIEARGYLGGSRYYEALMDVERQNIGKMELELSDLVHAMNDGVNSGTIKEGSEAWYEMQQSINDVKESIQEANIAMIEYNNSIRELNWSYFDYLQERISRIVDESEFLIDLMSTSKLYDDKGQLSDTGMATMGLHGVNYNTYMAQADEYAEELLKIDKDIANDPYNTKLIERREELLDLQQEAILAAEDEKQAIVDMVEEGIKLELSALQDLINAYNDSLDSAKDLYDYQKKVKDQTSEISKLQKQLAAYANDDSEENRARLQQIKVSLDEAQEALEETQYEQYIKDQKKLMDDLYSEYESILNARLDNVDALVSEMIDDINANSAEIMDTLRTESHAVGYEMTEAMNDIWADGGQLGSIITNYGENFLSSLTSLNTVLMHIESYVASMSRAGDNMADKVVDSTTPTTDSSYPTSSGGVFDDTTDGTSGSTTPDTTPSGDTGTTPSPTPSDDTPATQETQKQKVKAVKGQWWIRTGPGTSYKKLGILKQGKTLEYRGQKKGSWYAVVYKNKDAWISSKGSKIVGYDKGGYIAGMQKVAMRNGDDMVTVNTLKKGEAVLTEPQANLFGKFVENLPQAMEILDASKYFAGLPAAQALQGVSVGDINVNIPIDHVEDYDDLVTKMRMDPRFEKLIQSMTVDQLVGGSKFAKHKYNWN